MNIFKSIFRHFVKSSPIEMKTIDAKSVLDIHQLSGTIHYTVNLPGHTARTESDVFRATKKHLIEDLDTPCWVCGSKENRQVHHYLLEYSQQNAADWTKVKTLYPDFPDWDKIDPNDPNTFKYFTDSAYQMKVLCQWHHTGKAGIHQLPWPLFSFQLIKKDNFEYIPESKGFFDFPVDDLS